MQIFRVNALENKNIKSVSLLSSFSFSNKIRFFQAPDLNTSGTGICQSRHVSFAPILRQRIHEGIIDSR